MRLGVENGRAVLDNPCHVGMVAARDTPAAPSRSQTAEVTARQPPDPAGEWLTVDQAAAYLGLSASGFRAIGTTEGLEVRRRGNRPVVRRSDLDAYLERARIRPGKVIIGDQLHGRTSHHFTVSRRKQRPDLPGVAEVDSRPPPRARLDRHRHRPSPRSTHRQRQPPARQRIHSEAVTDAPADRAVVVGFRNWLKFKHKITETFPGRRVGGRPPLPARGLIVA